MTIQIAQRIGRALGVTSATKTKELDEALRAYVRSVGPGATLPVTGSVPYANLTGVPATFPPSAHTHPNGDLTGYTAADVLAKMLTVDGPGSGLDADLLDGVSSAGFALATHLTHSTWTPTDGSGAGLAFSAAIGIYTLHEDLVIARFQVTYPVTASGASAKISGLPFALAAGNANQQGFVTYSDAATLAYLLPSVSNLLPFDASGAAVTNVTLSGKTIFGATLYRK